MPELRETEEPGQTKPAEAKVPVAESEQRAAQGDASPPAQDKTVSIDAVRKQPATKAVPLTRARRKVYVIVSAETDSHSPFADELYHNEGGHYDVGEDELAELLEPLRPHVPCPVCKPRGRTAAVLAVHEGRRGRFAGCTSFRSGPDHHCGHTERVCERCEQGLMIRLGNGRAGCQNPQCGHEAPLCRCTVPRPMVERRHGKTGESFWGCQRYGMDGSCAATKRRDEPDVSGSVQTQSRRGRETPQSKQSRGGAARRS